jgi:DNA replication protein DnaC
METTIPPVSSLPCQACGAAVPYEPIIIMGRDFGKTLSRRCDQCEAEHRRAIAIEDEQVRLQLIANRIESTIPPELRDTELDHPDFNRPLWEAVRRWTAGPNAEWLGLIGPGGGCKTRILALLAMRGIRAGQRIAWTSAVKLQTEAERSNARAHVLAANAREHLLECQYAPVLVIDDIGKNTWDNRFERHFFTILDHRRNYRLPVLWSANVHPVGFSEVISKANAGPIIGRLMDRTAVFDLFPSSN